MLGNYSNLYSPFTLANVSTYFVLPLNNNPLFHQKVFDFMFHRFTVCHVYIFFFSFFFSFFFFFFKL